MFKGDIAKFSPADLLLFLAHLGKEGVLTVTRDDETLSLAFRAGRLVDAQGEVADRKLLAMLRDRSGVSVDLHRSLARAQAETGLPLRQLLETAEHAAVPDLSDILCAGLHEVLFQLFLWDSGQFQFAEIAVDHDPAQPAHDCQGLAMDITRQVDEFREILRTAGGGARVPVRTTPPAAPAPRDRGPGAPRGIDDASERDIAAEAVTALADGRRTLLQILAEAPLTTSAAAGGVARALERGSLALRDGPADVLQPALATGPATPETSYAAFRRTLRRMLAGTDRRARFKDLVRWCRCNFGSTLVLACRDGRLAQHTRFCGDNPGETVRYDPTRAPRPADDPHFGWVLSSGLAFTGDGAAAGRLLEAIGEEAPAGECAIVPLGELGGMDVLVCVAEPASDENPGPFQFLELLAWQVAPPPAVEASAAVSPVATVPPDERRNAAPLVEAIKDLPPMPDVVARILDLLADPETPIADVTEALSHDQALVARLIKVSNSSLYAGGSSTSSLKQAIVRLGTRTTRGLVVAASTRVL
ncbi:MAG: HDOD domain-containing protein, partial [Candidatus Krumholzibacteriia bacterium]